MKLCVALDMASKSECLELANKLRDFNLWLKVGMRMFFRDGAQVISEIKKLGNFKIFADLKIYDIPNTMADAAFELAKSGADMINLHSSAGIKAMQCVMQRLQSEFGEQKPLVLGVSALTSFTQSDFATIYNNNIDDAVKQMAILSCKSGLDGMVCSAFESKLIKDTCGYNFLTLCPGIRPNIDEKTALKDDQERVADVEFAKEQNADFIVIGRPIYKSCNPFDIVEKIQAQIEICK